jgi:hypothetical protein
MHPPLREWDEAHLRSLASIPESLTLEKKASAKFDPAGDRTGTKEELAKQVCAFANAGDGFLVYGIEKTGTFDTGVTDRVGTQTAKEWCEAVIRDAVRPLVHGFEAKFINIPGVHAAGQGVLVVYIPLSDYRPHWALISGRETPFIRAGEHSAVMSLQTLLDISSHAIRAQGVIEDLGEMQVNESIRPGGMYFLLNPRVRLESGPACELWGLELRLSSARAGEFRPPSGHNMRAVERHVVTFTGAETLFPRRSTRAGTANVELVVGDIGATIIAQLSVGSSLPVERRFRAADLGPL